MHYQNKIFFHLAQKLLHLVSSFFMFLYHDAKDSLGRAWILKKYIYYAHPLLKTKILIIQIEESLLYSSPSFSDF